MELKEDKNRSRLVVGWIVDIAVETLQREVSYLRKREKGGLGDISIL